MKQHLLIEKAYVYEVPRKKPEMENCTFSNKTGYWVNDISGNPLISEKNSIAPRTKKEDIETGEDQKGE